MLEFIYDYVSRFHGNPLGLARIKWYLCQLLRNADVMDEPNTIENWIMAMLSKELILP